MNRSFIAGLWQRTAFLRSGVGLAVVVVACVGLRLLWIQLERPAHLKEIANAFGSVSLFFGAPQMNHDGSRFTYVASDKTRCALFLGDTATGHKQAVVESDTIGWEANLDFHAWPWSPDDSSFIYTLHDQLVICPVNTNSVPMALTLGTNTVSSLVWLNPSEFAWLSGRRIYYARKPEDGQWGIHQLPDQIKASNLAAVDTNTIAWLQDGMICRFDLTKELPDTSNPTAAPAPDSNATPPTSGLTLWLDASTLHQADQTVVFGLTDLSSSKNDAVRNGTPPTYNGPESPRALNGKGTVHFTSADSAANATGLKTREKLGISGNAPRTVFAVMYHDASGGAKGGDMRISIGDAGARFGYFGLEENYNSLYLPRIWNRWANRVVTKSPAWGVWEIVYDGKIQNAYVNGALKGTNSVRVDTVDREVEIGLRSASPGATNAMGADGDFAELMIYNRALDNGERQQVENYLKTKWLGNQLLSSQSPLVWIAPGLSGMTGFNYSKATRRLLISGMDSGADSLWQLDTAAGASAGATQIFTGRSIRDARWAGSNEIVYASNEPGHSELAAVDFSEKGTNRLFENGNMVAFNVTTDGKQLFALGSVSNEPSFGIWQFDLASKQLRAAVPCSDYSSIYAQNNLPSETTIKLPSGARLNCFIYRPPNFNPHKKYPLVIENTTYLVMQNGEPEQQWLRSAAACGAYVVIVNRARWEVGLDQWGDNVMGAYQSLIHEPFIDASRVYLAGSSAETEYVSKFVEEHPGPWKGVAFLNPGGLPDFSNSPFSRLRPKILVMVSGEEHAEERLKQFQEECLRHGILADVIIHPGEGHRIIGNAARLERTQAMMHFIFEE